MGLGCTFEAGVCRDVEVAYDGDARHRRLRSERHLRGDGYGCDEFVHFTRYVGSCGWGVWLWQTGLFGDAPSPHR